MMGKCKGEQKTLPFLGFPEKGGQRLKIDVIIPVYKPGQELPVLLDRLQRQTVPINKIILMNTEKQYFEEASVKKYHNVEVHHLSRKEFDHGGTRHMAVQYSEADIFVLMTQDALPADRFLIERLTENLQVPAQGRGAEESGEQVPAQGRGAEVSGEQVPAVKSGNRVQVAAAYGRQMPQAGSSEWERISRNFNYPGESRIKTAEDLPVLGIKTFFCSNVCAAYRRDIYEKLGGFVRHTIFNEDMIYAAGVIRAGYGVAYEAGARVLHSHNYTGIQQLRRNFDLGVSQAEHPEVFEGVPSEAEGKRLVREVFRHLRREGRLYRFPGFCLQCCFKYVGYKLGRNYRRLPQRWITSLSSNKEYWIQA